MSDRKRWCGAGVGAVVVACAGAAPAVGQPCEPEWSDVFAGNGVAGAVACMAVYDAGGGPALYVGGEFSGAGGLVSPYLARWDGRAWEAVPSDLQVATNDLCVYDFGEGPELYVAGWRVKRYNGSRWATLGANEPTTWIGTVHVFDGGQGPELYASGGFGWPHSYIARWNGQAWSPVGGGIITVSHDMAIFDDGSGHGPALYCTGGPEDIGPFVHSVGRWDGASWSGLGEGMRWGFGIEAMAVYDDGSGGGPALYAGGSFRTVNPQALNRIARWDGQAWSPVGGGFDGAVHALLVHDDGSGPKLYAGGEFTTAGGVPARGLARWDGAAWEEVGGGVGGAVEALGVFDDGHGPALYVGGSFTTVGEAGVVSPGIARWGCPLGCRADVDGSGQLTLGDFVAFRNLYVAGDLRADFDRDGSLTLKDFVRFRNEYVAGCE